MVHVLQLISQTRSQSGSLHASRPSWSLNGTQQITVQIRGFVPERPGGVLKLSSKTDKDQSQVRAAERVDKAEDTAGNLQLYQGLKQLEAQTKASRTAVQVSTSLGVKC